MSTEVKFTLSDHDLMDLAASGEPSEALKLKLKSYAMEAISGEEVEPDLVEVEAVATIRAEVLAERLTSSDTTSKVNLFKELLENSHPAVSFRVAT